MKAVKIILWTIFALMLLLFLLPILVSPRSAGRAGAFIAYLPLGWCYFLSRNLPQITYNWRLIATGAICSALILTLGQWFMSKAAPGWRWRWTLSAYATVWILFAIAFGAGGLYQHTAWLLNDNRPWYKRRVYYQAELTMADSAARNVLNENHGNLERSRRALLWVPSYSGDGSTWLEEYDVVLYGDRSRRVAAYLIIPRDAAAVTNGAFALRRINGPEWQEIKPLSQLQQTLSEMDAQYSGSAAK